MGGEMSLFSHRQDFFLLFFFFSPLRFFKQTEMPGEPRLRLQRMIPNTCAPPLPPPALFPAGMDAAGPGTQNPASHNGYLRRKNHFMETVFPVFTSWEKIPLGSFEFPSGLFFICRLGALCAVKTNPCSSLDVLFGLEQPTRLNKISSHLQPVVPKPQHDFALSRGISTVQTSRKSPAIYFHYSADN